MNEIGFANQITIEEGDFDIPKSTPILPMRGLVCFPSIVAPLIIGRKRSAALIKHAVENDKVIGLFAQKNENVLFPTPDDIFDVGVIASIVEQDELEKDVIRVVLQTGPRIILSNIEDNGDFYVAEVKPTEAVVDEDDLEISALASNIRKMSAELVSSVEHIPDEARTLVLNVKGAEPLADTVSAFLHLDLETKQKLLETFDLKERLLLLNELLVRELDIVKLGARIRKKMQKELDTHQRKVILREQMKAIQKELGEDDESASEVADFESKIKQAEMPKEANDAAKKQLARLRRIPPASAEYSVVCSYLDWLCELPWSHKTEDNLDIEQVKKILDEDHFDLEEVKKRIVQYIAVRKLNPQRKGPILCLLGPPGVGKTSLGRSIARALNRSFIRVSLGGVHDEAEIRGHRRTYIGALPGKIIQGFKKAGTINPIFMLDEIDKLGRDGRGDPTSALLEVLDPEQNFSFTDHYLNVSFDLSKTIFITTANVMNTVPHALRDRMEVIEIRGYTEEQKTRIAHQFLLPRLLKEHGLSSETITFNDDVLRMIIDQYTKEAGLRNLERELAGICRQVAATYAADDQFKVHLDEESICEYLGMRKFHREVAQRISIPGVATGLSWTPAGGEIIFIEATKMSGRGKLVLTGQLGEVMKESARAALSWIRSNAERWSIDEDFFNGCDIHVHVPAGAIAKDGPSAGIAILAALVSLLTDKLVKSELALTGEISLRGNVLPIGGIKHKVLAARRAGIKEIILPRKNEHNVADLTEEVKEGISFIFVEQMDEVIANSLASYPLDEGQLNLPFKQSVETNIFH